MSPQDLFGVAVRTVALVFVSVGVALFLHPLLGGLGGVLIGVVMFLTADAVVIWAYRLHGRFTAKPFADWVKSNVAPLFPPKKP